MNYMNMRYVVSMLVMLPLAMNGMMCHKLAPVKKKVVFQQQLTRRSFFHKNSYFDTLIDDPQWSMIDADEAIRKEVATATLSGNVLCRNNIAEVQNKIVDKAIKYKSINTVLQYRFDRIDTHNNDFNKYSSDTKYAYLLRQLHRHVEGKVCSCRMHEKSNAWYSAYENDLDNISYELDAFDESLERE